MLAAILIIDDQIGAVQGEQSLSYAGSLRRQWTAIEVLGRAPFARVEEELRNVCDVVSVIANDAPGGPEGPRRISIEDLVAEHFAIYKSQGFEAVVIVKCGAYVELDLAEMRAFHQEQNVGVTRAWSDDGPLDFWILEPSALPEQSSVLSFLSCARSAEYQSRGYVNRLRSACDYRRLVLDSFHFRCRLRPEGSEIRPGIWVCDGARIERSGRLVAPAFIGRNVQIADECLITRGSNVESGSYIDFGTAVEDSSILSHSYVGIGLDLAHSVVDGCDLLNLQHNVSLQIADPVVMRRNTVGGSAPRLKAGIESGYMALSSAE